jgi:16S rRNA (uracil1498-N3)-methyltransferase
MREALEKSGAKRVALFVGPEGGFDPGEKDEALASGFQPVSLGPRVFRTETASIVGAAMVQFILGDLG